MSNSPRPLRRRPLARRSARFGVAAVEFAVCLPVIMLVVFASIEASSMIFLKIDLQATAYEAARVGAAPTGTSVDAINRGNEVLTQRNVYGGSVQTTPADITAVAVGGQFNVTATAPISLNRVIAGWFFSGSNLTSSCVMVREGTSAH